MFNILCDHSRGSALSTDLQRILRGGTPLFGRSPMDEAPVGTFTCPWCLYQIVLPGPARS